MKAPPKRFGLSSLRFVRDFFGFHMLCHGDSLKLGSPSFLEELVTYVNVALKLAVQCNHLPDLCFFFYGFGCSERSAVLLSLLRHVSAIDRNRLRSLGLK